MLAYTLTNVRRFSTSLARQRGLVVGAYQAEGGCLQLSPEAEKLDQDLKGRLRSTLDGMPVGIGRVGKVTTLSHDLGQWSSVAVAGLGAEGADFNQIEYLDEGKENARLAAGAGARALQKLGENDIVVEGFNRVEATAEGATLGIWHVSEKDIETKVSLLEGTGDPEDWERGVTKADSQNLVRCLCESPPNYMTPRVFATRARDLLCPYGVIVNARDTRWMKIHHFEALMSLGASSTHAPMMLELYYCADPVPATKPYMFYGVGVMFNSGGLCLRKCDRMMRCDFASGAIILGVMKAIAAMRLPVNVRAYIPLYEQQLGGTSMKLGDSFRVGDAVVAAEHTQSAPLIVAAEAIAKTAKIYPPELAFVLGTFSPNVQDMYGATSAVWARNDYVWDHVNFAGAVTGDRMWRMQLFKDFHDQITERVDVDVRCPGVGELGEPNLMAAFLNYFAPPTVDFTVIDVTGSSDTANGYTHYLAERLATGAPTRGIIQLLCHLSYCAEQVRAEKKREAGAKSDVEQ